IFHNCLRPLTFAAPTIPYDPSFPTPRTSALAYTGCDNVPQTWTYTYNITPPTFTLPTAGSSTVACAALAVPPTVPAVFDNCGRPITVAAPTIAYDTTCGGAVIYTCVYTSYGEIL